MAIEFACQRCSRILRASDGSGGRRSQCPSCKHVQLVPKTTTTRRSRGGQRLAAAADDGLVNIPCPQCKQLLACPSKLLGTRGQCRQCQHIFTISLRAPEAADSRPVGPIFSCPTCHQLFEGREEMRGRKGRCHSCQSVFTIPLGEVAPTGRVSAGKREAEHEHEREHEHEHEHDVAIEREGERAGVLEGVTGLNAAHAPAEHRLPAEMGSPVAPPERAAPTAELRQQSAASVVTALRSAALHYLPPRLLPKRAESHSLRTQSPELQPHPAHASRFKLPKRAKARQAMLVGSPSAETGLLNAVALQSRARRTLGAATNRLPLPIRFACAACHGLMEVPSASAGMETACPFCEVVQTIPAGMPEGDCDSADSPSAVRERLGALGASPAVLQNQWSAQSATRRRSDLTIANVFQTALENLFPTSLIALLHVTIVGLVAAVGLAIVFGVLQLLRFIGVSPGGIQTAAFICWGIFGLISLPVAAWFGASVKRMALEAVRRVPFDLGRAFSPGDAYGVSLVMVSLAALLGGLMRVPALIAWLSADSVGWLGAMWVLVMAAAFVVVQTLLSFACFAALDHENSREAIVRSYRMVMQHLPVMIAVKVLTWLVTIPLAILTLGFGLLLPVYVNAALYNLARNVASAPLAYSDVKKIA